MSEEINNREYRQNVIQNVISQLHEGKSVEEVKQQFETAFSGVSAAEISEAEQALISNGLPVSEVQRLCDVHAAVFKGSIEEIHQAEDQASIPGHPANVLKLENRSLEKLLEYRVRLHLSALPDSTALSALKEDLEELSRINLHYLRKENLLFPYMERYGITAPPKVMWGVDDEIRAQLKEIQQGLSEGNASEVKQKTEALADKIREMIFKEENIMLPMLLETLTQDEWKRIANESAQIGYLIDEVPVWSPAAGNAAAVRAEAAEPGAMEFPTGVLNQAEICGIFDTLPFDLTFVDADDTVKYFSNGAERIFPRTTTVLGRKVENCHPPASVHIVKKIVEDFKSGAKDHEDFWINMGGRFVYIRYYAVRGVGGKYLGTLEVTQDIGPVQKITGEKRLVSE